MNERISPSPRGLAVLAAIGPSLVWCAEYIGSGEVILATRNGALLGTAMLWAIVMAIILKCCIGLAGARWTVITGEGAIDLFSRMPGPRNWLIWLILVIQFPAAIVSIGALAKVAAVFLNALMPLPGGPIIWGLAATLFGLFVAWSGRFDLLKMVMSALVAIIVVGVLYVAVLSLPPVREIVEGFVGLQPLQVPGWASEMDRRVSPWREILPLMGWSAGGFASQVWYSYWVLGAGYGMSAGRGWGKPADEQVLASLTPEEGKRLRGWCRMVRADATLAMSIGVVVTTAFALAGAGVLRPAHLLPQGNEVALTLSRLFSDRWGALGGKLFIVAGSAAMVSTLIGQLCGWPRLLSDCLRIVYPPFSRLQWKTQFRGFLILFVATNLLAITFFDPVRLVQLGGQLDGILLTPIQALAILAGFVFVLPRLVPAQVRKDVRLGLPLSIMMVIAGLVFGILCVVVLPANLKAFFME
jgi:Mn2+/Fe2+ NRAMP family transporter